MLGSRLILQSSLRPLRRRRVKRPHQADVRDVMDDAERGRLVSNVAGHLRDGVTEEVLQHTFEYWKSIDKEPGDKIEAAVRNGSS
jgi:catalase